MKMKYIIPGNHLGTGRGFNPVPYHSAQGTRMMVRTIVKIIERTFNSKGVKINESSFIDQDGKKNSYMPSFDKQVKKYHAYCKYVRLVFADYLEREFPAAKDIIKTLRKNKKVQLTKDPKKKLHHLCMVYFSSDVRGDAENISKGIIDAVNIQDKYLDGAFLWTFDKSNPRVEVVISDNHGDFENEIKEFYRRVREKECLKRS